MLGMCSQSGCGPLGRRRYHLAKQEHILGVQGHKRNLCPAEGYITHKYKLHAVFFTAVGNLISRFFKLIAVFVKWTTRFVMLFIHLS